MPRARGRIAHARARALPNEVPVRPSPSRGVCGLPFGAAAMASTSSRRLQQLVWHMYGSGMDGAGSESGIVDLEFFHKNGVRTGPTHHGMSPAVHTKRRVFDFLVWLPVPTPVRHRPERCPRRKCRRADSRDGTVPGHVSIDVPCTHVRPFSENSTAPNDRSLQIANGSPNHAC